MAKKKQIGSSQFGSQFDLIAEDDVRLVTLVSGLTVYTNATLSKHSKGVLAAYERFLEWCPRDLLTFYATETMRRHKPVTKATFGMLPTWLKAGAPQREFVRLQLKDGAQYQDAPKYKFDIFGIEPKSKQFKLGHANSLSLAFPPEASDSAAAVLLERFVEVCSLLPFQSGSAGYSFECSKYEAEASHTHAWSASMRHPGIDISRTVDDSIAVGHDAIKGVGWLTVLNDEFVTKLGGVAKVRRAVAKGVEVISVPNGIILQAGPGPSFGDANKGDRLPLQQSVFRLVAPFVDVASKRSPSFNLDVDYVERTERWFMRLGNG